MLKKSVGSSRAAAVPHKPIKCTSPGFLFFKCIHVEHSNLNETGSVTSDRWFTKIKKKVQRNYTSLS